MGGLALSLLLLGTCWLAWAGFQADISGSKSRTALSVSLLRLVATGHRSTLGLGEKIPCTLATYKTWLLRGKGEGRRRQIYFMHIRDGQLQIVRS